VRAVSDEQSDAVALSNCERRRVQVNDVEVTT
jgi:hypothetical protein